MVYVRRLRNTQLRSTQYALHLLRVFFMCVLLIPSVHEDMDSLLEKPQEVRLNRPYLVHFRINDQESFCVRNLSLSEYLRLIHDDEYTVNYIRTLITSNAIKNTDENINVISRSKDDVNFESIDVSLYLEENQISEGMILLEELEAFPDMSIPYVNADTPTSSTQEELDSEMEISVMSQSSMDTSPSTSNCSKKSSNIKKKSKDIKFARIGNKQRFQNKPGSFHRPLQTSKDVPSTSTQSLIALSSSKTPLSTSTESSTSAVKAATCITMSENVLKNRTSKLKSHVWDHFIKRDAATAQCLICMKILKHGGNTTNLTQHLIRKHPTFGTIGSKQTIVSLDTTANKRKKLVSEDEPSENANMQKNVLSPVQSIGSDQKIDNVFQRAQSFADGRTSFKNITNAILYMLATDHCPLSTVENEGFRTLMKTIAPRYKIPSRRTITRYMDDKYVFEGGRYTTLES
ncbi:uncharacterized protein [Linepithema humile]|uniref:uncharacterized protein isoform X2 n=1 Tax=Linepithema humile TaxID=83485 RepID=UPI00351F020C